MISPYRDRRYAARLVILLVWGVVSWLHWQAEWQVSILVLTAGLAIQTIRLLIVKPGLEGLEEDREDLATVSILVPAKNESTVLPRLVYSLFHLDYPPRCLDTWVVNDGSTDATAEILHHLQTQFPGLQVYGQDATGGKSGALNAVLPNTRGEIVLVCDADAQVPAHFLRQTVAHFQNGAIAAIQVRKTLLNWQTNFLTNCQQMEMCCDSFLQTRRIAIGGMAELRGNGMLVRRTWLDRCHGWSEDTITDDLDLTFKLYLAGGKIAFLPEPAIQEEGVTTWRNLWRQRCRWAEGGYQRYLDYGAQLLTLGWQKNLDLILFLLLQFLLPIALIPDLLWSVFYDHHLLLFPLQMLFGVILMAGFMGGLYQFQCLRGVKLLWATLQGSIYMLHWIPVMILVTHRLCIQSQQSHWLPTERQGTDLGGG